MRSPLYLSALVALALAAPATASADPAVWGKQMPAHTATTYRTQPFDLAASVNVRAWADGQEITNWHGEGLIGTLHGRGVSVTLECFARRQWCRVEIANFRARPAKIRVRTWDETSIAVPPRTN